MIDDAKAALRVAGIAEPTVQQIEDYIQLRYHDSIVPQNVI